MKKAFKAIITNILGWQVRRLVRKHPVSIVAVTGSIGKTSTKRAIAKLLATDKRVCYQDGNYNDIVSVPLIFFNKPIPSLFSPLAWLRTILSNEKKIYGEYPYDVVVLELGTDAPGQIQKFSKYLSIDLLVITAITPEHMEFFADLDAVAREELIAQTFSKVLLVNKDLCAQKYIDEINKEYYTYSIKELADYRTTINSFEDNQYDISITIANGQSLSAQYKGVADVELYSVCAASAVAHQLGIPAVKIIEGIGQLQAFNGRMKLLKGLSESLIIDDTYNASPVAVKAALDALYKSDAPQRIALLGNMNELGDYSARAHAEVGEYCDPNKLDVVITLGPDANRYLAEAAEKRGCKVERFNSPYEAGEFIKKAIKPGAVILAKGSQNGVYAEEAIKYFLADPKDEKQLVRQTPDWLSKKSKQFHRDSDK